MATQDRQLPAVNPQWKDEPPQQFLAELGGNKQQWQVMTKQFFPAAKKPEVVMMAATYLKARGIDFMAKAVHVVPMYNNDTKQTEDTILPGIALYQIQAHRTGEFAGSDEPIDGPEIKHLGVLAPEWCSQTVYRLVKGEPKPFTAKVRFAEFANTTRDGQLTKIWKTKPYMMLQKCALAAALRVAFPEETGGQPTAEEMEGEHEETRDQVLGSPSMAVIASAGQRGNKKPASKTSVQVEDQSSNISQSVDPQPEQEAVEAEVITSTSAAEPVPSLPEQSDAQVQPPTDDPDRKVTPQEVAKGIATVASKGWNSMNMTKKAGTVLTNLTLGQFEDLLFDCGQNPA